jgi:hypothetical protein
MAAMLIQVLKLTESSTIVKSMWQMEPNFRFVCSMVANILSLVWTYHPQAYTTLLTAISSWDWVDAQNSLNFSL